MKKLEDDRLAITIDELEHTAFCCCFLLLFLPETWLRPTSGARLGLDMPSSQHIFFHL